MSSATSSRSACCSPADGRRSRPPSLPGPGRASAWLERRAARIERDADGRSWLAVDYQVIAAPRALASVPVPGWELAGPAGTPALRVPAATISVGPLTAVPSAGQAVALRPDRPAPAIATGAMQRRLWLWLAAVIAACSSPGPAWLGWRDLAGDAATQPFARALRQLRVRGTAPAAGRVALHHAFDRTAGEVLRSSTLPRLFERAPQFVPLRGRIEDFYAQSAASFFAGARDAPASPLALCRDLRRIERRSQR